MNKKRSACVVIGPGAIGCAVAAAVTVGAGQAPFIAGRTPIDSLHVTHPNGVVDVPVTSLNLDDDLAPADIVLLCVKAHQTASAVPWLERLVDSDTVVAIFQNGVEHLDRLQPLVHAEAKLVPVVVSLPAQRAEPGVVVVGGAGHLAAPASGPADLVADLFTGSFLSFQGVDDWQNRAWTKLMMNAAAGGISAFTQTSNSIFEIDEGAAELARLVMHEVAEVGRAEGAVLADDLPDRLLDALAKFASSHRGSIVVDRGNGVATEWDARNEVVPRIAARHGIAVPYNRTLATLLRLTEPTV